MEPTVRAASACHSGTLTWQQCIRHNPSPTIGSIGGVCVARQHMPRRQFRSGKKSLQDCTLCQASPSEPGSSSTTDTDVEGSDLWIEQELRARKRRRQEKEEGAKAGGQKVQDAVKTDSEKIRDQIETYVVQGLGLFFTLILVEGLVLALAGFLPQAVDDFAEKVLYPSFTPTVLAFLACSSAYGLWKSRQ